MQADSNTGIAVRTMTHDGLAARVVMGAGSLALLPDEVRRLGGRRVLLMGRTTAASATAARVRQALGPLLAGVFDEVTPHSGVGLVERVAGQARQAQADLLLALGGGSVSDTAKAVAILLAEGGPLARHATRFTPPDKLEAPALDKPKLPIIAVPTTASAAEVTPGLGIRDDAGRKLLFRDPKVAARTVILDPEANTEVPAALMLGTGMNALAHCVESLYSRQHNPVSDALAVEGIRLLARGLPAVRRDPASVPAREEVLYGSHLSGMALVNARPCLHHALCHCLGALGGVSHGDANAIMLPHVMRFNRPAAAARLRLAAQALGVEEAGQSEESAADAAIEAVVRLQAAIGVPMRLRDTQLDAAVLPAVADHVLGDRGLHFNPGPPVTHEAALQLLQAAW